MPKKRYGKRYFRNRKGIYRIRHGAEVELLYWGKNRRCVIDYEGERIVTMGYLLSKEPIP
jgi:hypothetical protein